ncbi:helix-turn-helix domain-containing protein [Macrococcoides bohemicum]|uniref:HTH cro/C1-type domain-containing protein n=1 Tax=Macrococcoides bohemicum TaxID=1903056 RepID=A0A328A831_9STAP|nr:helix-turn-helix domain-containing protein [Macrococcus bohemicus]RAK50446.1 hypothetical protein BHX94_02980 [Macrococcus bohemicus]
MTSFSSRLKLVLKEKNISQSELSKSTGIGRNSISDYINGKYEPKNDKLNLIAKALNVNEKWLAGFDVEKERINEDLIYMNIGKQIYDEIIKSDVLNDYDIKALNYFKDTYEFESILIYSIKKILSVPFLEETFRSPQDIIDKLPTHKSVIYFYFLQTFKDYYKDMVKTNENLILNTLDSLYYLKPDEEIDRYPESMKIEFDERNIYVLDILENNLSQQLINDIDNILDNAMKKIKDLQNKYPMSESKKIAYLYNLAIEDIDEFEQSIKEIEIHPQNFASKKEYIDYLENIINEYYQKHK